MLYNHFEHVLLNIAVLRGRAALRLPEPGDTGTDQITFTEGEHHEGYNTGRRFGYKTVSAYKGPSSSSLSMINR